MGLRRLRGVDAYVWYNQTPTNHMHTLKVAILDTAGASVPYSADRFISELNDRLHRIPSFRWLLRETPLGLHHPVWVEDPDFDIARHVLRATATAPGGPRERDELIGNIAETPLPTDRPLWQLHLIEGLADGQVAAVVKIHHAMADGNAAANQLLSITDDPAMQGGSAPIGPWICSRCRRARGLSGRRCGPIRRRRVDWPIWHGKPTAVSAPPRSTGVGEATCPPVRLVGRGPSSTAPSITGARVCDHGDRAGSRQRIAAWQ